MFLHANISHLFFNMFALFIFGLALENEIGPKHFLSIYFLAGIAGSIGYMITASNPLIPALGASGAIYGAMGALAMLMPFMMVWVMGMVPLPMIAMAIIWALMEFFGIFDIGSGIAHGAHLGGLFIGMVYGLVLRMIKKKRQRMERIRFEEGM
jgi:membrane associated rhomboid family serine protease